MSKKDVKESSSLHTKSYMGGINGGKGYLFQNHYISANIPLWLNDNKFQCLCIEATGDVDVKFSDSYIHIQVKDHSVAPAEFREIIESFEKVSKDYPNINYDFTLACSGVGTEMSKLVNMLNRYKGVQSFFEDVVEDLEPTREGIVKALEDLKLGEKTDFIIDKVSFEPKLSDFHSTDRTRAIFVDNITKYKDFGKKPSDKLRQAFLEIFGKVQDSLGQTLKKEELSDLLVNSVETVRTSSEKVVVNIQNWTKEIFPSRPDYNLDWSEHFDREKKTVPTSEAWDRFKEDLKETKNKILESVSSREILFQGRTALSTGLLFGHIFSQNGGWTIEVEQPQIKQVWSSSELIKNDYHILSEIKEISSVGESIALVCDITGKGLHSVENFLEEQKFKTKEILRVYPPNNPGSLSIKDNSEAVTFSLETSDLLRERINATNIRNVQIFFYGPLSVSIFLGQRLTCVGEVTLFEFQNPGYVKSVKFRT